MQPLDLLERASRLLLNSPNLTRSLNTLLCLLQEEEWVLRPLLFLSDSVTHRYFLELAPALTEEEKTQYNRTLAQRRLEVLEALHHELFLSSQESEARFFPMELQGPGETGTFFSFPLRGSSDELLQGMLCGWLSPEAPAARIQTLRTISHLIALSLKAHGLKGSPIRELRENPVPEVLQEVISANSQMLRLAEVVRRVAPSRATVLLRGESGTGKEVFARAIHHHSLRRNAPFKAVNCGALSNTLLESELFGHERGAFTSAMSRRRGWFELADGGTLFLDEIGNTSLEFQAKLLRVLQEGSFERLGGETPVSVDVRVVCATNAPLEDAIHEGRFREDLFYRINVIPLELPPLRDRKDDIPFLVRSFVDALNQEYGKQVWYSEEDLALLTEHDWPGNVRELQNAIHSAFLMAERDRLALQQMMTPQLRMPARTTPKESSEAEAVNVPEEEIQAIRKALQECRGIQRHAAQRLGISLRQLRYRIEKYQIPVRKIRV